MKIRKLLIQSALCCVLAGAYIYTGSIENERLLEAREAAVAMASQHYEMDLKEKIAAGYDMRKYGKVMDEVKPGNLAPVYSAAGGLVTQAGEDDDLGKSIRIEHDGAISIYGNCNKLYVKEGQHVRKGQVIASFKNTGDNSLYYRLKEVE